MFDVIVVGGGPAGLSAALMLGRCRRRVLVCDLAQPRNRQSRALHGYLTRDGVAPVAFVDLGRGELAPYGVQLRGIEYAVFRDDQMPEYAAVSNRQSLFVRKQNPIALPLSGLHQDRGDDPRPHTTDTGGVDRP